MKKRGLTKETLVTLVGVAIALLVLLLILRSVLCRADAWVFSC